MNTPWEGEAAALAARIAAFLDASLDGEPPEPFEALALALHRYQRAHSPAVASLTDGDVPRWEDLPAVPTALFQRVAVGPLDPASAPIVFRTSGTTTGRRGAHALRSTELYDRGAIAWFRRCVPSAPTDIVALLEDPAQAPDSSLSHMVALFGDATWHVESGSLARASLDVRVRKSVSPLFVATTAFALADWLTAEVPVLPPDSVLMITGGFKGRKLAISDTDLFRHARRRLRPARIVTEYGMTELSSQLWGGPETPFLPPPWLRVLAVSPATGEPLEPGRVGQLRFFDLCNLDSTIGVETLDEGVVHPDGSLTLYGRLAGAPARGCSLVIEEGWGT